MCTSIFSAIDHHLDLLPYIVTMHAEDIFYRVYMDTFNSLMVGVQTIAIELNVQHYELNGTH